MEESAGVIEAAQALAEAFKQTEAYRLYRKSRVRVEEKPDLADRLHHYKKTQAAYEHKRLQNQSVSFDEEKYISHLHGTLMLNEDTRVFLQQEEQMLKLYRQVMDTLDNAWEIDLFSF